MSPCGDKLQHPASNAYIRGKLFPSPCGDKLQCTAGTSKSPCISFRPLTGINCNLRLIAQRSTIHGFRPLAGINCNSKLYPKNGKILCRNQKRCIRYPYYTSDFWKRKEHFGANGCFSVVRTVAFQEDREACREEVRTAPGRRSSSRIEEADHSSHLDSAEGASKP